jgi:hypothetical protein
MFAQPLNLIQSFTTLELTLISALALNIAALIYVFKQWLILRYVFFTSSDWCAEKINEICDDATERITELAIQIYEAKYSKEVAREEAMKYVSTAIRNGASDWFQQKEKFQNKLEKNGQPRLGYDDGWLGLGARWCTK